MQRASWIRHFSLWLGAMVCALGCGGSPTSTTQQQVQPPVGQEVATGKPSGKSSGKPLNKPFNGDRSNSPPTTDTREASGEPPLERGSTLAGETPRLGGGEAQGDPTTDAPLAPPVARTATAPLSAADAQAFGLRRIDGQHLILYTDLPADPAVDELPKVFDLAVPEWCKYFGIPVERAKGWRIIGSLIKDKQRFLNAKLLPARMPPFLHGFQVGEKLWLYEQPTEFYRRHLLLHEGVHGFMNWYFRGCGPPWYMEGIAELLATHRWADGKLQIHYSPRSKEEAPHWGRVRIIKDDYAAGRGLTIPNVLAYGPQAHLQVEPYGWSWAAANFFDNHPTYQSAFRGLTKHAHDNGPFFNEQFFYKLDKARHAPMSIEWQVYVANMEYGYDVARSAIEFKSPQPLPASGATVQVSAERGWQSTGFRLQKGKTYRLTASGQFQIARDTEPWISEASGITIRYYRKRPLGRLLAAVEDWSTVRAEPTTLLAPISVGESLEWTAERDGDLFLQLNDSPAERADNMGAAAVKVEHVD